MATLVAVPASVVLWGAGGYAFCGTEVYDTPPGSAGDTVCTALVDPIVPWALLASVPFLATLLGGFVGIRLRSRGLFAVALLAPFLMVGFALFAMTAFF